MQSEKTGSQPDYNGDGIAIWKNSTKEGKVYLSVQLFGKNGVKINAFKNEPKPKEHKYEFIGVNEI